MRVQNFSWNSTFAFTVPPCPKFFAANIGFAKKQGPISLLALKKLSRYSSVFRRVFRTLA